MYEGNPCIVRVQQGLLRGCESATPGIYAFKGIPYAAPPVGKNRWAEPKAPVSWDGIRDATQYGPYTPQYDLEWGSFYQKEFYPTIKNPDEDGLYLNVWTGAKDPDEKLPVLVWIHGGAFVEGSGSALQFIGDRLAAKGIVVVTINYRLGVFGFFSHPELTAEAGYAGTYAFLDQVAALKWVKENIAFFGGDPDNVTIDGQSAGGASVGTMVATPLARGLFHKAIIQSASVLRRPTPPQNLETAQQLGIALQNRMKARNLEELRSIPWQAVLFSAEKLCANRFPTPIDGYVLPKSYNEIFNAGEQAPVPIMLGSNLREGCIGEADASSLPDYEKAMKDAGAEEKIMRALFPADNAKEAFDQLDCIRSAGTMSGMIAIAEAQVKIGQPTYLYCFDKELPNDDGTSIGAFHSAELVYQFGTLYTSWRPFTAVDQAVSEAMMNTWVAFCKTGNPNNDSIPNWKPYTSGDRVSMRLGENPGMSDLPYEEQIRYFQKKIP